jgi:hypothetical protein
MRFPKMNNADRVYIGILLIFFGTWISFGLWTPPHFGEGNGSIQNWTVYFTFAVNALLLFGTGVLLPRTSFGERINSLPFASARVFAYLAIGAFTLVYAFPFATIFLVMGPAYGLRIGDSLGAVTCTVLTVALAAASVAFAGIVVSVACSVLSIINLVNRLLDGKGLAAIQVNLYRWNVLYCWAITLLAFGLAWAMQAILPYLAHTPPNTTY